MPHAPVQPCAGDWHRDHRSLLPSRRPRCAALDRARGRAGGLSPGAGRDKRAADCRLRRRGGRGRAPRAAGAALPDRRRSQALAARLAALRIPAAKEGPMKHRQFNKALAVAGALAAVNPFAIVRAQAQKLKVGVILPRSGYLGFIGQSCQKGADLAPGVIKEMLGVELELMNADFESNVDTARTRAERLIQEGAHVLVGPFDSGAASAIAQVAEQKGIPFVINIAAAPQITEQGYKFVFRNFPTAAMILSDAFANQKELFEATGVAPKSVVFMHVNDTFGTSMQQGINAVLPRFSMPYQLVEQIAYDPTARDLSVEVAKAKATA